MLQMCHIDLLQELNKTVEAGKPVSELLDEIRAMADFELRLSHCTILACEEKYECDAAGSELPLVDFLPYS